MHRASRKGPVAEKSVIPFGPQHPVLPEPIHFDLVTEDETVVDAFPVIGYQHRGLERLIEKKDFVDYTFVAERICGICGYTHGFGYCQTVEQVMGIEGPGPRAIPADDMGRAVAGKQPPALAGPHRGRPRFREPFYAYLQAEGARTRHGRGDCRGRMIFGCVRIGGVRRDVEDSMLRAVCDRLTALAPEIRELAGVFLDDYSVRQRLEGVGVISGEEAYALGMVGPMLRASGVPSDTRLLGYAAYKDLTFTPVTVRGGDCYARCRVRIEEIFAAIDLIKQAVDKTPPGPVEVRVTGAPQGEFFGRVEQPRGEVVYDVKGNGEKFLERFHVRVPTFANLPGMVRMLKGSQVADVPVIILTIDPCISCTER